MEEGHMNEAPDGNGIHSCRVASLACKPLHHQRRPGNGTVMLIFLELFFKRLIYLLAAILVYYDFMIRLTKDFFFMFTLFSLFSKSPDF